MARVLIDTSIWIEFFRKHEPYYCIGLSDCFIAVSAASVRVQVATLDGHFEALRKPAKINLFDFT